LCWKIKYEDDDDLTFQETLWEVCGTGNRLVCIAKIKAVILRVTINRRRRLW